MTTTKRYRRRNAKPGQLLAYYGKLPHDNPDVVFSWGGGEATSRHGALLHFIFGTPRVEPVYGEERQREGRDYKFGQSALQALEAAGCDLTTLRFSIEMKRAPAVDAAIAKAQGTP